MCEVFSSQDERLYWRKERVFFDPTVQERVLAARAYSQLASSRWPLVFDPHKQFCQLLKMVEGEQPGTATGASVPDHSAVARKGLSLCFDVAKISDQSLLSKLVHQASGGGAMVLILDAVIGGCDQDVVALLCRGAAVAETDSGISIHPNFRLYLVIEDHLEDSTVPLLLHSVAQQFSNFSVVNLDLATSGLCNYFQRLVMDRERPGYLSKMKSMDTDWTLHQHQLEMQQVRIMVMGGIGGGGGIKRNAEGE